MRSSAAPWWTSTLRCASAAWTNSASWWRATRSSCTLRGGDGKTPLHFARTIEVASYLLDHGADIDARDIDHESTPAQYMLDHRVEVARYLVQKGCRTDILLAAAVGDVDRVRACLTPTQSASVSA